jgi:hypothetical protein
MAVLIYYFYFWTQGTVEVEITTPTPDRDVVFRDNFANRANGWDDAGSAPAGGHYKNGAYYVYAEPDGDGSTEGGAPRNASSVYPTAPPNLTIAVDAKALAISDGTAYGIGCRMTDKGGVLSGYLFMLGNENVWISKYGIDGRYQLLTPETGIPLPSGFKVSSTNRLEAGCSGGEGDQAVGLVFTVNGAVAAKATDSKDPLSTGTVALLAEAYEESKKAIEVDFDNFVVEVQGGVSRLPYGPDTCRQGYVWRDAFPNDHVCVTPQTRQQIWDDNRQASARRDPTGPYGPDTCKQGYVWREAIPSDHVCVTPATRQQAQYDNRQAAQRRAKQ